MGSRFHPGGEGHPTAAARYHLHARHRAIGAADEFGLRAEVDPVHVNDLHATVLKLLGLDHRDLTYLSQGRDQRLTDVEGDHEFADRLLG